MGFYDDIKLIDTILDKKDNIHKPVKYPCYQDVRILTAHIRRVFVPRQINSRSGVIMKAWMPAEGVFTKNFVKRLKSKVTKDCLICPHCMVAAWVYVRVGAKTHTIWLKGEGKDISFVKPPNELEWR